MRTVEFKLPSEILQRAEQSDELLVRDISKYLLELTAFREYVDREFRWRETPLEVFKDKMAALSTEREMNSLYWRDVASTIKVYSLSTTWRILELSEQLMILLGANGVLGPAILGRSLVELTSAFILNGDQIRRYVTAAACQWHEKFVGSEELENLLNKAVFGTRRVEKSHYLFQTNIQTLIEKLGHIPGYESVPEKYGFLCEIAHPNVVGNARFWSDWVELQSDGTVLRRFIPRSISSHTVQQAQDASLWAISWSAANVIAGFSILNEQVGTVARHFPADSDLPASAGPSF